MERQEHAATDSELYDTSPSPASVEHYLELTIGGLTEDQGGTIDSSFGDLPLQPIHSSPPHWDQESNHYNWVQHDMPQQLGIVGSLVLYDFWNFYSFMCSICIKLLILNFV